MKTPTITPKTDRTFITVAINLIFFTVRSSKVKVIEPFALSSELKQESFELELLESLITSFLFYPVLPYCNLNDAVHCYHYFIISTP